MPLLVAAEPLQQGEGGRVLEEAGLGRKAPAALELGRLHIAAWSRAPGVKNSGCVAQQACKQNTSGKGKGWGVKCAPLVGPIPLGDASRLYERSAQAARTSLDYSPPA